MPRPTPSKPAFRISPVMAMLAGGLWLLAGCAGRDDAALTPLLTISELQYDAGVIMTKAENLYTEKDYDQAAAEYERFLELHPVHRWAPHAQFKLALSYAHQIPKVGRDPTIAEKAKAAFERVLAYPGTRYEEAAKAKLIEIRRYLGQSDLAVGRFYYKQQRYPAAIARFQKVLDAEVGGEVTEDAWYGLALAYERDGQIDQAAATAQSFLQALPHSRYAKPIATLRARLADRAS